MSGNRSAFQPEHYDQNIRQTVPYYDEFYLQAAELVNVFYSHAVKWLDIGCGTGKMGSAAFESAALERFVFCDVSDEMIRIVRERFRRRNAEFLVCEAQKLAYADEFDVVTSILVNHYFRPDERRAVLKKSYEALKENGLYICFENFAPFTDPGTSVCLEKWKRYQIQQGKSPAESAEHIRRYGKDYFPVTLSESMELLRECGFQTVEILWLSNMQAGFWAVK